MRKLQLLIKSFGAHILLLIRAYQNLERIFASYDFAVKYVFSEKSNGEFGPDIFPTYMPHDA
jgi:hypothetical protein